MTIAEATVGTRVRTLIAWSDVEAGIEGVIDEDYGGGVMVAWDLPRYPLPGGYRRHDGTWAARSRILRDGFDTATDLRYLEVVEVIDVPMRKEA